MSRSLTALVALLFLSIPVLASAGQADLNIPADVLCRNMARGVAIYIGDISAGKTRGDSVQDVMRHMEGVSQENAKLMAIVAISQANGMSPNTQLVMLSEMGRNRYYSSCVRGAEKKK